MTDVLKVPPANLLDQRLTSEEQVQLLSDALRAAAFQFDQDDSMTIATASDLKIADADDYARGFELLEELANIGDRITDHYDKFDGPLKTLTKVVRSIRAPQLEQVTPIRTALQTRLGKWKAESDARDRAAAKARQEAEDAAARAAQQEKAKTLERIAASETDPALQRAFREEAAHVAVAPVFTKPVEVQKTAPAVSGHTRASWRCIFTDMKALMRAYVEGRCHIPDDAFINGLQSFMDKQAATMEAQLTNAYPGTRAVVEYKAISVRR